MVRREDFCLLKFLPLLSGFGGVLEHFCTFLLSQSCSCPYPPVPFSVCFPVSGVPFTSFSEVTRQHSVPADSVVAEFCPGRIWMALSGGRTQRQQRSLADIVVLIGIVGIRIICKLVNYNLRWGMWNYVIIVCPF